MLFAAWNVPSPLPRRTLKPRLRPEFGIAVVDHDEVRFAVAVQFPDRHAYGDRTRREVDRLAEAAGAAPERMPAPASLRTTRSSTLSPFTSATVTHRG